MTGWWQPLLNGWRLDRRMEYLWALIPLLSAWLLDRLLGDPIGLPHPVVLFGRVIAWCERTFNRGTRRLLKGACMAILLVTVTYLLTWFLLWSARMYVSPWCEALLKTVFIFYCLAGTTLVREVRQVFFALDCSLEAGRRQVARIVGRDTQALSAQEVRTAALETLAENLNDGVIAPLCWYLLLGVPGMMAYKMINTLDSMVGYRNERYRLFGRWAARMDDVANFIPARLTACLMVFASGRLRLLKFVKQYGNHHASPNSGYPEAALAGILDCRFGGPHDYFGEEVWKPYIGSNPRLLTTEDMQKAIAINRRAEGMMLVLVIIFSSLLII